MQGFEEQLGSILAEQFESALSILALDAQQHCDDQFEDERDEFSIPFPLYLAVLLLQTPRAYYHSQSAVLLLQLSQLTPHLIQLRKSSRSICIHHQSILSSHQSHACSDSSSLSSVFWILNYN